MRSDIIVGPMVCQRCARHVWWVRWFDMVWRRGMRDIDGIHHCRML